ncbi:MAG: Tetratricopeptide 1 repeat-containing protein [Firmicutes bacterium]|nr:Tetratricopeptide 1 repeat-containing protein [Bacillota bacterium]
MKKQIIFFLVFFLASWFSIAGASNDQISGKKVPALLKPEFDCASQNVKEGTDAGERQDPSYKTETYASKLKPDFYKFYTVWVTDANTGIRFAVLNDSKEIKQGTTYEWQGDSLNGLARGAGIVNEYKNAVLSASYQGNFVRGKFQGHIIGHSYGKNRIDMEWDCVDGIINGKVIVKNDGGNIELLVENNEVCSFVYNRDSDGRLEVTLADGEPVSGKFTSKYWSYEGGLTKSGANGTGILKLNNGIIYEGEFKANGFQGQGKLTLPNGRTYIGEFKDGKVIHGTMLAANGNIYEGEFWENKFQGQGKYTWRNGRTYIGEFKDGKLSGYGTLYDAAGKVIRQGRWENNKPV